MVHQQYDSKSSSVHVPKFWENILPLEQNSGKLKTVALWWKIRKMEWTTSATTLFIIMCSNCCATNIGVFRHKYKGERGIRKWSRNCKNIPSTVTTIQPIFLFSVSNCTPSTGNAPRWINQPPKTTKQKYTPGNSCPHTRRMATVTATGNFTGMISRSKTYKIKNWWGETRLSPALPLKKKDSDLQLHVVNTATYSWVNSNHKLHINMGPDSQRLRIYHRLILKNREYKTRTYTKFLL
jgi:hypothetical protein